MLNSFAARATVPVTITITGFVIVCCLVLYSYIRGDLLRDTVQHEVILADTIVKSTRHTMLKSDRDTLRNMITSIGGQESVEHVRIFNKKGVIMFSADPAELNREMDKQAAGCSGCHKGPEPATGLGSMEQARHFTNERGVSVVAITAPVYNEPGCWSASCHVHPSGQKILGTLDIGLSQETYDQTMERLRWRMIIFCLMILILSVGGVNALLRRFVLSPVRGLAVFADQVSKGNLQHPLPRGDSDIESIARIFLDIAVQGDKIKDRPGECGDHGKEEES